MKRFIIILPAILLLFQSLSGQDKSELTPPTNVRNGSDLLPNIVDVMWTPPEGWVPSPVDRWYYYDRGIYGGNAIGSCPGCPVEVAIRWDAYHFNYYDELYVSKIRYVLKEPALDYALRVYQVEDSIFDTAFNYPLQGDLVYNRFDTMSFMPIPVDISKELWVGLWVSDMGPGYPLAAGNSPVTEGYANLIKIYNYGYWQTLTEINPDLDWPWNIGVYLETPDEWIIFPVFNVYRSVDNMPFEKIHEGHYYDTIYHDVIGGLNPSQLEYYVTCIYQAGESVPSDILHISLVKTPEISNHNKIEVFPNPASDCVRIKSGNGKIRSLSLTNTEGEQILNMFADSDHIELDISHVSGSFYILKIITEEGVFTSKLLIFK
jgi:hypothetical protein